MCPPAAAASRSAAAPAGSSRDDHLRPHADHALGRRQRGPVGGVAQQRLADALAEDARPRRARRPSRSSSTPRPSRVRRLADSPPGPRSSDSDMPEAVSTVDARQARVRSAAGRARAAAPPRRAGCWRGRRASRSGPSSPRLPAEPRGEPAEEQEAGDARVRPVAHRDLDDSRPSSCAPGGRVEAGGDPLAPRRRAQPGEVHHVGLLGRARARAGRPCRGSGSLTESTSTTWAMCSSESTASAWPCGDQTSVARSGTTSGSTIVSRCGRCCGPDVQHDLLVAERDLARAAGRRAMVIVSTASIVLAARLDRAEDRARGVVAAHVARAGSGSRRATRGRRSRSG